MNESETKHNPCDYCIEFECEHLGMVCPFYKEEKVKEDINNDH